MITLAFERFSGAFFLPLIAQNLFTQRENFPLYLIYIPLLGDSLLFSL